MLVLQNAPAEELRLPELEIRPTEAFGGAAKFDLTLDLRESPEGLSGVMEYSTDLFDAETVARLAAQLETLLEGVAANPDRRVSALPLLTKEEGLRLVADWNATVREFPKPACVAGWPDSVHLLRISWAGAWQRMPASL